ncbi:MAG: hypothetical protein ACRD5G_01260 [Candidatus Acidiferrales bacterium]
MFKRNLTTGQRTEVRLRLTKMEADAAVLFMCAENLTIHLDAEMVRPVTRKLAELVEALRQLKVCVQEGASSADGGLSMNGDGPDAMEALERLMELRGKRDDERSDGERS